METKRQLTLQLIDFVINRSIRQEIDKFRTHKKLLAKRDKRIAHKVAKCDWKDMMREQDNTFTKHGYKPQAI